MGQKIRSIIKIFMGWDYEHRIAYGIIVDSRNNPELKDFLDLNSKILKYDQEMSLGGQGTLFVYIRSTYKIIDYDFGSYTSKFPDITGDDLEPPLHPIIHKIDDTILAPILTKEAHTALSRLSSLCSESRAFNLPVEKTTSPLPFWIRHSYISW